MTISIEALETTPVVVLRVVVAGLLVVILLAVVLADERQPHVELSPPHVSLALPPTPVASGRMLSGGPI